MKIYNEITLEWNENTKRYDNVVSEDSYEYDGELELAQYGTFGGASRLAAATMGRKTQWDLTKQAEDQAKRMGRWSGLSSLLGTGAGMLGSMIPGLGSLGFAGGKGLANLLMGALYKPEDFASKTGWGQKRYEQLGERGERFRSRQKEEAATGFLRDALLASVYPEMSEKMGEKFKGGLGKVKGGLSKLFGGGAALPQGVQPMSSLGGDKLLLDLAGATPDAGFMPGFGKRAAFGGGPASLPSLQDVQSSIPAASFASVLGQPGGAVPELGMAPKLGYPVDSDQFQLSGAPRFPYESAPLPKPVRPADQWLRETLTPQQKLLEDAFGGDSLLARPPGYGVSPGMAQDMPIQPQPLAMPESFTPWTPHGYRTPPGFQMNQMNRGVPFQLGR